MTDCNCCGFPIDSESHIFNTHCAASNAEYDQILAHIAELQAQSSTPEEDAAFEKAKEAGAETLAYIRFIRDLQPY